MDNSLILTMIGGIIAFILLVIVLYAVFGVTARIIPANERLIIYRFGRIHRIGGPDAVQLYPGLDDIRQVIRVYDRVIEVSMPETLVYGVPNELDVSLWGRFDPVAASRGSYGKLERLLQMSDEQRLELAQEKVREAVIRQIANVEEKMPLPAQAGETQRLLALAPASPIYNELLAGVKYQLSLTMPAIGVLVDTGKPVVLRGHTLLQGEVITGSAVSSAAEPNETYRLSKEDLAVLKSVV